MRQSIQQILDTVLKFVSEGGVQVRQLVLCEHKFCSDHVHSTRVETCM